ncbi:MAG: baseplate J/gp47 family protein [Rectinemataceae bacterium]
MSDTTSDSFGKDGLTVECLTDIVSDLTAAFQAIYGSDINLDSDSPDGQILGIFAQAAEDLRELLLDINAGFDPDQAAGTVLDQRVALNNITRNGGSFTIVPVMLTVNGPVSLVGLDENAGVVPIPAGVYTVQDAAGNQYALLASVDIPAAGTYTYSFQAAEIGNVQVALNSITVPVTVLAQVTAINNPNSPTTQGQDEETDSALRVRRAKSTAIVTTGYLDALESALASLDGVTSAQVYDSTTGAAPAGMTANSIWAIIAGGNPTEIGQMLYAKKAPGVAMMGSQHVAVTRADGVRTVVMSYDVPTEVPLYVEFTLGFLGGAIVVDTANLMELIAANVSYSVGAQATNDVIVAYLKSLNPNYLISICRVSIDNVTWVESLAASSPANQFVLSSSRITIN